MRLTRTAARDGRLRRNGRERRDCAAGGAGRAAEAQRPGAPRLCRGRRGAGPDRAARLGCLSAQDSGQQKKPEAASGSSVKPAGKPAGLFQ